MKGDAVRGFEIGDREWLQRCLKSLFWRQRRDLGVEWSGREYYLI